MTAAVGEGGSGEAGAEPAWREGAQLQAVTALRVERVCLLRVLRLTSL